MAACHHEHQRIPRHHLTVQLALRHLAFDQPKIGVPILDRLGDLRRVTHPQVQFDPWMLPVQGHHALWQPVICNCLARVKPQPAARVLGEILQNHLDRLGAGQQPACLGHQRIACLGQDDAPPHAIKELDIMAIFQRRDRSAHRRLREVQRIRRTGHMQTVCHGQKDTKLFKGHGRSINKIERFDNYNSLD